MGSDVQWVKIREEFTGRKPKLSWHVFSSFVLFDVAQAMCGRSASAATLVDNVPNGEKTCESCLRTLVR